MLLPAGIGRINDSAYWRSVRELYLEDWVEDALDLADQLGGRDSNELEAEAMVRRDGQVWTLGERLTVEALPGEIGTGFDEILALIRTECEKLAAEFAWDLGDGVLIAILPRTFDQPWMPGRWGYFVDKTPCDKICIPGYLLSQPPLFRRTLRHEFMHAVTLNLGRGHASRWLNEAMSTFFEGRLSQVAWNEYRDHSKAWLDPLNLVGALSLDLRDESQIDLIVSGYDQSSILAHFLYLHGGNAKLGELLRAVGDESFLPNLEARVIGRTPVDNAIRHVYGWSEKELFELALNWVCSMPVPEPVN